jgi:hypothetical protein
MAWGIADEALESAVPSRKPDQPRTGPAESGAAILGGAFQTLRSAWQNCCRRQGGTARQEKEKEAMVMKKHLYKQLVYGSFLKSSPRAVMICLIDMANPHRGFSCFPAIGTIAQRVALSISTVKRALRTLVRQGFLQKAACFYKGFQQTNLYTVLFPGPRTGNGEAPQQGSGREDPADCPAGQETPEDPQDNDPFPHRAAVLSGGPERSFSSFFPKRAWSRTVKRKNRHTGRKKRIR